MHIIFVYDFHLQLGLKLIHIVLLQGYKIDETLISLI